MLSPEKMCLLKIAIHKSKVPALLNLVPKYQIHIQEFKQPDKKTHHHLRREKQLNDDIEEMEQTLAEIEEKLIFYFQKLSIDPDEIEIPEDSKRLHYTASKVKEIIDHLYEDVSHDVRMVKGYLSNREKFGREQKKFEVEREILNWMTTTYKVRNYYFDWFDQLSFKLGFMGHNDFSELEIALEHEEIPLILDFDDINTETTAFFLVYHKVHEEKMDAICQTAKLFDDCQDYLTEEGMNLELIESKIKEAKDNYLKSVEAIEDYKKKAVIFRGYLEIMKNCRKYNFLEKQFRATYRGDIVRINGFIPLSRQDEILTEFDKRFHDRIRIYVQEIDRTLNDTKKTIKEVGTKDESYELSQFEAEEDDIGDIPSLVKTPKIFKPFRLLTQMYGVTNYHEIDPTPFVAIFYPILFGLMFGDVGHGLVLFAVGLLLIFLNRKKKSSSWYDGGFLLMWLGVFAMIAGFLYGTIFGNENILTPLFASPMDEVTKILKFSVFLGVVHLSLGFIIKFMNYAKNKQLFVAFMEPFCKLLMLWGGAYVIFTFGFRISEWFGANAILPFAPVLLVIIPSLGLLLGKPIGKMLKISYLQGEKMGNLIVEQAMDFSETYLSMLSNGASYTRLLALAMAHMGLMLVLTSMVAFLNSFIGTVIVLILGNLFVILLEAMLAAVHALRLTFYEFFGKFYEANGIPYEYIDIQKDFSVIEFQ